MMRTHILLTLLVLTGISLAIWRFAPPPWTAFQIVGLGLLIVGFVFWTIARFQLGRSFTVSAQAKQLVTRGLYSRFRNPVYIFGSCVIAGFILTLGHPEWLLVFIVIIPLQMWRARKESAVLEASFGEEYRRYRASTWF